MGTSRLVKLAVTVIATIGSVAGLGALSAGTALATPQASAASAVTPDYEIKVPVITVNSFRAPLYNSNNTLNRKLSQGTTIEVTCYYKANPPSPYVGDGYIDHVVWVQGIGNFTGHVPDAYVNLGGDTPPKFGIPKCPTNG